MPRRTGIWVAAFVACLGLVLLGWGLSLTHSAPVAAAPALTVGANAPSPGLPAAGQSGGAPAAPPPAGGAVPPDATAPPPEQVTDPADEAADQPGLPQRITLERQHVAAPVVPIGVTDGQALDLPVDPKVVGWWSGGSLPGAPLGSALLAGHIDSAASGAGAFAALLRVSVGDPVDVTDDAGVVHHYRVTSRGTYLKAALPAEVFRTDGDPALTLVTCGGPFDRQTHHYRDNVVVEAVPN